MQYGILQDHDACMHYWNILWFVSLKYSSDLCLIWSESHSFIYLGHILKWYFNIICQECLYLLLCHKGLDELNKDLVFRYYLLNIKFLNLHRNLKKVSNFWIYNYYELKIQTHTDMYKLIQKLGIRKEMIITLST